MTKSLKTWHFLPLIALLSAPAPAHAAGFSDEVIDDPVLRSLADAVETMAEAYGSKKPLSRGRTGTNARGPSGTIAQLILSADDLTCAAWILSFRRAYLDLLIEDDPPPPPELLAKAHELLQGVIAGCREILDEETYANASEPGFAPEPSGPEDAATARPHGYQAGVAARSTADRICLDRCAGDHDAWFDARIAARGPAWKTVRLIERFDRLGALITDMGRQIEAARRDLRTRQEFDRNDGLDSPSPATARALATVSDLALQRDGYIREAGAAREEIAALAPGYVALNRAEATALTAYRQCIVRCRDEARLGSDPSDFAETLAARLETAERRLERGHATARQWDDALNVLWLTAGGYKGEAWPVFDVEIDGTVVETIALRSESLAPYRLPLGLDRLRGAEVIRIRPQNPDAYRGLTIWSIEIPARSLRLTPRDGRWVRDGAAARPPTILRGAGELVFELD